MSEKKIVENSNYPVTTKSLVKELKKGGINKGETIIVHSSLSSLGWVCGGAVALINALKKVITENGNLVMPTHCGDYSEPKYWGNPAVPENWWKTIREEMPAYHPEITPTRDVGVVPETFRKYPATVRSDHPVNSFAAWGADKEEIIKKHKINSSLGEKSPLQKIYNLDGKILLIGVDHGSNTSLHLAEYMANYNKNYKEFGAPIIKNGKRTWVEYEDLEVNSADFIDLGKDYENEYDFIKFKIGHTKAKLFSQVKLIDYAVEWFERNR